LTIDTDGTNSVVSLAVSVLADSDGDGLGLRERLSTIYSRHENSKTNLELERLR